MLSKARERRSLLNSDSGNELSHGPGSDDGPARLARRWRGTPLCIGLPLDAGPCFERDPDILSPSAVLAVGYSRNAAAAIWAISSPVNACDKRLASLAGCPGG